MFRSPGITHTGSPPHLRGARRLILRLFFCFRITPAPAGSTEDVPFMFDVEEDHPRTCGEHEKATIAVAPNIGSPPHLRGAPKDRPTRAHEYRITPAPAGSTLALHALAGVFQDHPRTCGEHLANCLGVV